jgi:D-lactate dehydrogenase
MFCDDVLDLATRRHFLKTTLPSAQDDFFECTDDEGEKAFLHRFVTVGAPVRGQS